LLTIIGNNGCDTGAEGVDLGSPGGVICEGCSADNGYAGDCKGGIEELEAGKRRGSVIIPEGRHGQGWTRLAAELRNTRSSLWKGRDFRERKGTKVVSGRSYAEVLGQSEPVVTTTATLAGSAPTKGGRVQSHQMKPVTTSKILEEAGGGIGGAPAKTQVQVSEKGAAGNGKSVTSVLPKALENPVKPGEAALKVGFGSEGDGLVSVHEGVDLQGIKNCLTDIRGQLELGLKRVEAAFRMLEIKELRGGEAKDVEMGSGKINSRATQSMGREEAGWSKPKRKKFRRRNFKSQPGLLGTKPSKAPIQTTQGPGHTTSSFYRILDRNPVQQARPAGESSEMGAARASGVNETIFAGDFSGEHLDGIGDPFPAVSRATREADKDGEQAGGSGQGEEASATMLSIIPESAETLGVELVTPEEETASLSLQSNIPESNAIPGFDHLTPGKSFKRLSDSIECAGELGLDDHMPVNLSNQLKVFQRRVSPLSKSTKSWVAERVSWNGGRGFDMAQEDFPELGDLGDIRNQEEENPVVEGSMPQSVEHLTQGIEGVSPVSKELVWNVKRIAGLSSDRQEGKLDELLGNIVDEKYGDRASSSTRVEADGIKGMRDADFLYEA
jgi:hypothetical protein